MATSMISTAHVAGIKVAAATPFSTAIRSTAAFPATRRAGKASRSASVGKVYCMKVWPTRGKKKFETLSYLPPLSREQLAREVQYLLRSGWVPCLEFQLEYPYPHRENNRSPGYYDGRYWTMWKLPMFGCTDPVQVLKELDEAVKEHPTSCVRILGFDNVRQVQCISFIAYRPEGV